MAMIPNSNGEYLINIFRRGATISIPNCIRDMGILKPTRTKESYRKMNN